MNMSMQAPLPSAGVTPGFGQKTEADYPTKMAQIAPGSQILVGGPRVGGPAFLATVLQTYEEWGATGEPALFVSHDATKEELVISQAAGYEVTVTASAASFITDKLPPNALKVQLKPVHGVALQFRGGIESATEIIRWALGRGAPRYNRGSDTEDETITFGGIGNTGGVVRLGDYIILHDDGSWHIHSNLSDYEEEI